jgi:hypothetical protein
MDNEHTAAAAALRTFWRRVFSQLAVQREREAKELRAVLERVQ